jgi:NADH:ubiquinone oxidoreductase subunit F (NADH-binding)
MMTRTATVAPPVTLPRLVARPPATALAAHVDRYGALPAGSAATLVEEVRRAGLRGRGGAGFPTAVKLDAVRTASGRRSLVRGRRAAVVVANGTEGEPASTKDAVLLTHSPHLVLDGAVASALAVGADRALVCVDRVNVVALGALEQAMTARRSVDDHGVVLELVATPSRYVAGEESALVHFLNGGDAKPTLVPPRPFERGVDGRSTLVSNVETLAQIALIARFGAAWWRQVGTADDPGSALFSLSGAVGRPGVYELPLGAELGAVLRHADAGATTGVLIGGYFGTWLRPATAASVRLGVADLAHAGASLGCGVIAPLPSSSCPLAEVARITRWLAGQSAGQCGPCAFGLPAIAEALDTVVAGDRTGRAEAALRRWLAMVDGRGACKLPDGVNRFVSSALDVFGDHLATHRRGAGCGADTTPVLPLPRHSGGWR